jgi:hypothetical protein
MRAKNSLTGQYLSGRKAIPVPTNRRIRNLTAEDAEGRRGRQYLRWGKDVPLRASASSAVKYFLRHWMMK